MNCNLIEILHLLHKDIVSQKRCGPDFSSDTPIELADHQPVIQTGVIYLVSQNDALDFLSKAVIQPGATVMISDVTVPGTFTRHPMCESITVVEFRCSLNATFNQLAKAMSRHFRSTQRYNTNESHSHQAQLLTLWKQIRSKTLQGTLEIKEQLRQLCPDLKSYIRLFVIVGKEQEKGRNWAEALQALQSVLPNSHLFFDGNESDEKIIGFQFLDQQNFGEIDNQDAVETLLDQLQLSMMVSNATRDYSKLNTLYSITHRACMIAERLELQPNEHIYHFERYSMYEIIDLCTQRYMSLFNHSDIINLVHPIVVHLTRYDEKHRTNLRDILFYYLRNSQDIKRTAEVMYMHRNTVSNKINQIRNICHIDFEDGGLCQRLLFSCQVILYYEKVLHQRLMRNDSLRDY